MNTKGGRPQNSPLRSSQDWTRAFRLNKSHGIGAVSLIYLLLSAQNQTGSTSRDVLNRTFISLLVIILILPQTPLSHLPSAYLSLSTCFISGLLITWITSPLAGTLGHEMVCLVSYPIVIPDMRVGAGTAQALCGHRLLYGVDWKIIRNTSLENINIYPLGYFCHFDEIFFSLQNYNFWSSALDGVEYFFSLFLFLLLIRNYF